MRQIWFGVAVLLSGIVFVCLKAFLRHLKPLFLACGRNQLLDKETAKLGYLDWRFKKNALGRWTGLLIGFLEGGELRETDSISSLWIAFWMTCSSLRGLQDICAEEWGDEFLE